MARPPRYAVDAITVDLLNDAAKAAGKKRAPDQLLEQVGDAGAWLEVRRVKGDGYTRCLVYARPDKKYCGDIDVPDAAVANFVEDEEPTP